MTVEVEDSKNTMDEPFLGELKSQFEKLIDLRKTLDSKANTMITIASSIITLNVTIGTFLITTIAEKGVYYSISIGLLALGVILGAICIWRFIQSYAIRNYQYPMGSTYFFEDGRYKKENVEKVRGLKEKEFNDRMFKGYLDSIRKAEENNESKTSGIKKGQTFLTGALITITLLVGFILVSAGLRFISLS